MLKSRIPTKVLRDAGRRAMAAAGMPLELAPGGTAANQLYRVAPNAARHAGEPVRLRTNNRWAIIAIATGPEVDAPIEYFEGVNFVVNVCVNPEGEIETYFAPAARVREDMTDNHRLWMAYKEKKGERGNSTFRIVSFRQRRSRPWLNKNFAEQYAQYKLETPAAAMSADSRDETVIERARRLVADELGVPPDAVEIKVKQQLSVQHVLARQLLPLIFSAETDNRFLSYGTLAEKLGRPSNHAKAIGQACDLIDAASALADVPLIALWRVQTATGEHNPNAFGSARRHELLAQARHHEFTEADQHAIEQALDDLRHKGNHAAWDFVLSQRPDFATPQVTA